MTNTLDHSIRRWASLGAGFDAEPASRDIEVTATSIGTIDLERLLLETARYAPAAARLFIMAATWLHEYGDLVAKHRLKRLIRDELETEHQATLGLLLDAAQQGSHALEFQSIIKLLKPSDHPRPLFERSRRSSKLAEHAHQKASALSRRWKLWCQAFEFKNDALRPASWMMSRHPDLRTRADFRGDLWASILAALRHDQGAGESELRLAALCGGSRAQVRSALRNLEMTGRITAGRRRGANRRAVSLREAA
ncbi:MAG: hypothetical protein SGJ09_17690 [Phycisphaerae bacterium]|nr:hypothetical protein [Phycisphaerae bacterium]